MEAQATYLQKNSPRILELLEPEAVVKSHQVLLRLGNSCLELGNLGQAAVHFEELRKFGDTAETEGMRLTPNSEGRSPER